jgi:hypothetical protein
MSAKSATKASARDEIGSIIGRLLAEIATLRKQRADLNNQFADVESRPIALTELPGRVDGVLEALKAQADELVPSGLLHADSRPGDLAADLLRAPIKPVALMALLHADTLRTWLLREAEAELSGLPDAMPTAERTASLKSIEDKVLQTERKECSILWEGEAAGLEMPWRPDLDPRAVLDLE